MNEVYQRERGAKLIDPFSRAVKSAKDFDVVSITASTAPGPQRMRFPQWVWQSGQTINDEGLRYQQKDCYFDNDQFFGLRDDT